MTQQKPQIENGTVIKRPSMFNNMDGILNGMKWDANGKSALFFFSVGVIYFIYSNYLIYLIYLIVF